jgi:hypothetical protein
MAHVFKNKHQRPKILIGAGDDQTVATLAEEVAAIIKEHLGA